MTKTLLIAFSMLFFGCSSSSSTSPEADAGSSASALAACSDSAHAICAKMNTCSPSSLSASYGDTSTYETRIKASCLDGLSAPSTGGTPEKTEACAQAYATYSCTDYRDKTNIPSACAPAAGSGATGAACLFAAQCQSSFCAIAPGSACGNVPCFRMRETRARSSRAVVRC